MAVERKDPATIGGLPPAELERFLDQDVLIRSGRCPNGCGLLTVDEGDWGQECPVCKFSTNCRAELTQQ